MVVLYMIFLLLLFIVPILLLLYLILEYVDPTKNEDGFNKYNSWEKVQCNAKDKCDWRYSCACDSCRHNCGPKKLKVSFEKREEEE